MSSNEISKSYFFDSYMVTSSTQFNFEQHLIQELKLKLSQSIFIDEERSLFTTDKFCGMHSLSQPFPKEMIGSSEFQSKNVDLSKLQYHGTTTLAIKLKNSVLICVDSKASIGSYVGSRTVKKVFKITNRIVSTMAGGAADCLHWIRRTSQQAKIIEYRYDTELRVESVAKLLASSLREYRGAGLSVGTMVAGYDTANGPSLYYVDSNGSCVPGSFFCVGSGANLAYSIVDCDEISLENMSLDETIDLVVRAVRHATVRDGYSGGYINVLQVDEKGCRHLRRIDSRTLSSSLS
eukprot:gene10493-14104_t